MNTSTATPSNNKSRAVFQGLLRLTTVRFRSEKAVICGAVLLDDDGEVYPSPRAYSVKFSDSVQSADPRPGQTWLVTGIQSIKTYTRGHHEITEIQVTAKSAELKRPSGEHIVQLMARSNDFPGIGEVTARKLWGAFGEELYDALDEADETALSDVIGPNLASVVLDGWKLFAASDALAWLHRSGIEPRISRSLLEAYGSELKAKLEEDPYRTLVFGMSWAAADHLAINTFGLRPDDPRRLSAAVESRLYAALEEGHTALAKSEVLRQVALLLGQDMARAAVASAMSTDVVIAVGSDLLSSPGMEVVEHQIAEYMHDALHETPLCSAAVVVAVLQHYEMNTAASHGEPFGLNDAQRKAVAAVAEHGALLITGGAGVGKTTVLRAIVALLDHVKFKYRIMTVSGRAARRATQATGQPASTIAGYLRAVEAGHSGDARGSPFALIVDEASMLDVLMAWRIIKSLPTGCRIILIGDPGQLPPVGPGLTLHAMIGTTIPTVELIQSRRFGGEIAAFSREIREALLSNSIKGRTTPDPRRSYPTRTVSGVPSCVKRLRMAARTCSSAT